VTGKTKRGIHMRQIPEWLHSVRNFQIGQKMGLTRKSRPRLGVEEHTLGFKRDGVQRKRGRRKRKSHEKIGTRSGTEILSTSSKERRQGKARGGGKERVKIGPKKEGSRKN